MYEATEQRDFLMEELQTFLQLARAVRDGRLGIDSEEFLRGIIHAAGTVRIVTAYAELDAV